MLVGETSWTYRVRQSPGVIVALTVAVVVAALAVGLLRVTQSPQERIDAAKPPAPPLVTATVERRVLRDVMVLEGEITSSRAVQVSAPDMTQEVGRLVVTSAPPAVGTGLTGGSMVAAVSGQPLFLLSGQIPLYRDITPGMTGADVEVLQAGLERAGYAIYDSPGTYGPSTQAAVAFLWETHGFKPVMQEVALPTPGPVVGKEHPRIANTVRLPVAPWRSFIVTPHVPASVAASHVRLGEEVEPNETLLELSASLPVVTLQATAAQAENLHKGLEARLTRGSRILGGTVLSIGHSGQNGLAPVLVQPRHDLGYGHLGEQVRADIEVSSSGGKVLAVPVSAIRSDQSGRDGVVRVLPPSANGTQRREMVHVRTGSVVGGWVEVTRSDPSLSLGDEVLVGSTGL